MAEIQVIYKYLYYIDSWSDTVNLKVGLDDVIVVVGVAHETLHRSTKALGADLED